MGDFGSHLACQRMTEEWSLGTEFSEKAAQGRLSCHAFFLPITSKHLLALY
jgi:hypothetical protein